jgi:MFS family permease
MMSNNDKETPYRWYILTLAALTHTVAVAMPLMCMPVLFKEISEDLGLSLIQIGSIWGLMAFPALFTSLGGGIISDRLGTRRTLIIGCLLAGITGALRGFSYDIVTLGVTAFVFGMVRSIIPMTVHKTCGVWFSSRQLGVANGAVSMGMALGFMAGSLVSATLLSPWLGGWRNVLFLYGAISIVFSVLWFFSKPHTSDTRLSTKNAHSRSLRQTLLHVGKIREIWLLGVAIFGIGGGIQGMLGYLPLYLRNAGWTETAADGALATFHGVSMLCTIPFAFWSDRLGSRKRALMAATLLTIIGCGLLSGTTGRIVWVAVITAGLVRDGFMAVFMTMIIEIRGIGADYAGTAFGFVMSFIGLGNLLAPPIGNSLAAIAPGLPFLCWTALAVIGLLGLSFVKETRNP